MTKEGRKFDGEFKQNAIDTVVPDCLSQAEVGGRFFEGGWGGRYMDGRINLDSTNCDLAIGSKN